MIRTKHGVIVIRYTHPATKRKHYTPSIRGKNLRLSWKTKTNAEIYGDMILNRYIKKLAVLAASREV